MVELDEVKRLRTESTQLSKVIEKYSNYQNGEKTNFIQELKDNIHDNLRELETFIYVVTCIVFILFWVLVFFGYKLYKSLVERERRKEEKKRQKLQKKKK